MGRTCVDQRQPGSRASRPTTSSPILIVAAEPFSRERISSGVDRLFIRARSLFTRVHLDLRLPAATRPWKSCQGPDAATESAALPDRDASRSCRPPCLDASSTVPLGTVTEPAACSLVRGCPPGRRHGRQCAPADQPTPALVPPGRGGK